MLTMTDPGLQADLNPNPSPGLDPTPHPNPNPYPDPDPNPYPAPTKRVINDDGECEMSVCYARICRRSTEQQSRHHHRSI